MAQLEAQTMPIIASLLILALIALTSPLTLIISLKLLMTHTMGISLFPFLIKLIVSLIDDMVVYLATTPWLID